MITFTIDLEDPTERYDPNARYIAMTRRILDMCAEIECRATFFTVGKIAMATPDLIQDIAARGHEIAYHSHAHIPLTQESPERFKHESKEDKDRLEQLAGKSVIGFRAPAFSLTPQTVWALDILKELGFQYSSSIMPTRLSRYGFPDAPRTPFKWPNGLVELPLPVARCGPLLLPYLGGIYMYALPSALTYLWATRADRHEMLWTYTHPYDFDREEKFAPMANTPAWASFILWVSRRVADKKIKTVLGWGNAPSLGERYLGI